MGDDGFGRLCENTGTERVSMREKGIKVDAVRTKMRSKAYPGGRNPSARPTAGFGEEDESRGASCFPGVERRVQGGCR